MMKLLIIFLIVGAVSASRNIEWWNIKAAQKQGPNVCAVEQDPETQRKYYTECKYWRPRSICGKQTIIKYECCEGFRMIPGHLGCMGVEPLVDVVETARRVGAKKFANLLEQSGVARELDQGPAVTLFAPSDEAFDAYLKIYGAIKPERFTDEKYKNLATYHLVNKRIPSNQWGADSLIESKLAGVKIRINKYSNGMETVNCKPVLRKNQQAKNGVVHVIDGVLLPDRYQNLSIIETVITDGRFNVLADILNGSDTVKRLVDGSVPHTFFAPSDEAFQKLPRNRLNKILANKESREALIANHVVLHPICLPGIISEHRVKTIGPHKLSMNCTSSGQTVEARKVRQDFLHGPDGLVYLIDDVLLPDKAKTVMELVNDVRLDAFARQIRNAGLEERFENFDSYTLFAPSEAAMYSISQEEQEYMERDREKAKEFVLSHAVFGKHTADSIYDNQVVTTLDEKTPLRLQIYRGSIGIEDATVEKADIEGSNGVLHVINKVLRPNTNSLNEVLRANGNFSIWLEAMDKILEVEPQEFNEFRQSPTTRTTAYTYFIPSDEAFKELGDVELKWLMGDSTYLAKTLKNHVVEDMMTLGGFKRDLQYAVKTKQSTVDILKRNDVTKVNGATFKRCDMLNRNGVAHEINKVLLPPQEKSQRRYLKKKRGVRRAKRTHGHYSFNSNH